MAEGPILRHFHDTHGGTGPYLAEHFHSVSQGLCEENNECFQVRPCPLHEVSGDRLYDFNITNQEHRSDPFLASERPHGALEWVGEIAGA